MDEVRWHRSFNREKGGVMSFYSNEDLAEMKVLTAETENGTHIYAVFRSHVEVYNHLIKTKPSLRIYNERVGERQLQKPRFDIDIDDDKELLPGFASKEDLCVYVRDRIIEGVLGAIKGAEVSRNVLVYTSHGEEKASCHIIIDGYCHSACHDAQGFYELVVPDEVKPYVDRSIYDRNHLLRMIWCHKRLSSRVKTFNSSFLFRGEIVRYSSGKTFRTEAHERLHELSSSMVTYCSECETLPSYGTPKSPFVSSCSFDADRCGEVMEKLVSVVGDAYIINGVKNNTILLRRVRKCMCQLCGRDHDPNTLPFVTFRDDGSLHWFCGRKSSTGKRESLLIGKLSADVSYMEDAARKMCDEIFCDVHEAQCQELRAVSLTKRHASKSKEAAKTRLPRKVVRK